MKRNVHRVHTASDALRHVRVKIMAHVFPILASVSVHQVGVVTCAKSNVQVSSTVQIVVGSAIAKMMRPATT